MTAEIVKLRLEGPIAVLTMDRPPVNALDETMYQALSGKLDEIDARSDIRVVILTAAKGLRAFSAGADIKDFERLFDAGESYRFCRLAHEVNNRFERLTPISMAAIDGAVLGGGAELVLAFDLRVSSQVARIGFPEVTVGQAPLTGGTLRLPWLIGESAARAILLSGEAISADRAYQLGLFHLLVPSGLAFAAALEWGQRLARHPAQAVLGIKQSLVLNRDHDVHSGTDRDSLLSQWIFEGEDAREGHNAFVEKREPRFSHGIPPLPDGLQESR